MDCCQLNGGGSVLAGAPATKAGAARKTQAINKGLRTGELCNVLRCVSRAHPEDSSRPLPYVVLGSEPGANMP